MVLLMLLMSMAPLLTLSTVSAHAEPSGVTWPLEGSNDTGWVTLDAIGANASGTGAQASADWNLSFAPGAELSNVTLEIRVSGEDGMVIEGPLLAVEGMGTSLFDWSGSGMLGESNQFDNGAVYEGRLNPNSNSDAGWTLPSDAEITDMVIQALAPVDPAVSLRPVETIINDYAVHPGIGFMYVAVNNDLLMLDVNADPIVIDMMEFTNFMGIDEMVVDANNGLLHLLAGDGTMHALSLDNSSLQPALPSLTESFDTFILTTSGEVFGADASGVSQWDGVGWNSVQTTNAGTIIPESATAMIEVNGVLYTAFEGAGVYRYDLTTNAPLSSWNTGNTLHSDDVTTMAVSGNQLLLGSSDNGLARFDFSAGFWLSTWTASNWLDSNDIAGLARVDSNLYILNGPSLHVYNTTNGIFSTTYALSDFGLQS
jgi:hypothetical protein